MLRKQNLPSLIYSASQVRELDRITIEDWGVPGFELMHKASMFTFRVLMNQWPDADRFLVLCGGGNNGGDGYLVASIAKQRGLNPSVLTLKNPDTLSGDARRAYEACRDSKVNISSCDNISDLTEKLAQNEIIVDAILGTGLNSNVKGLTSDVINTCNTSGKPILAVDIPSGLSADTGQALGTAIEANATATFIGTKLGQLTGQGQHYTGQLYFDCLDVPHEVYDQQAATAIRLKLDSLLDQFHARKANAHKGDNGRILLIGGEAGYGGAITLAAMAAARMGSGLTKVATHPQNHGPLLANCPEVMPCTAENMEELASLVDEADVIVIGPGLAQTAWSNKALYCALQNRNNKPIVLDADALNLITKHTDWLPKERSNLFYTPHPGEAARLLSALDEHTSPHDIESDRLAALSKLQHHLGGHVLLKGSGSLIKDNSGTYICAYGNPGMGSGGMGDVLSGFIGALLAQGFNHTLAFTSAIALHAKAADNLAAKYGERGLLASDLIPEARKLLNKLG